MDQRSMLRKLPSMNDLLNSDIAKNWEQQVDQSVVKEMIEQVIQDTRKAILAGDIDELADNFFESKVDKMLADRRVSALQPVVNATGVVLHTNLGRAKLAKEAEDAIDSVASHATNLEYDITIGQRGDRYKYVGKLVSELTGADDAIVVNNNAAAVMLVLSSLFNQKELIISRGQLVEIGGSFRIPDIITSTGGILKEVGTTNKTHLKDYENAISEETGGILRVHTSNYKLIGFSETPTSKELATVAHKYHLPLVNDLGSGLMIDLEKYGLGHEPTIQEELEDCDLVMFSGDKLLGGPQAGIIAGKQEYIDKLKHNQLLRALRVDKMTLSALIATLKLYRDPESAITKVPVLRELTMKEEQVLQKAKTLQDLIEKNTDFHATIEKGTSMVGGGSFPDVQLPTYLIDLESDSSETKLNRYLEYATTPIITRVSHGKVYLDLRSIDESDFDKIIVSLNEVQNKISK
ncbi:L-seryl-tRNA(Sec) selenium transferase [Companilactobacillus sp.]|jgi:L-seryl-tRNA(Ser) seleniumtransferase|uniref:L-seryl-tRNA(Sec) selenium transferase n=1 Tax=Companilactobacillus sp. TaxID=2767905 RepID=UPI0025C3DFBB|nr:L-seryl-tRNA(Sec) selenium transferase [Companilactobacillus sp.]MCH4010145.1 L-seryl-tRNA(Sec) selenium transferase [Companilactobacillus sp.]MCH4052179.1 L-seryl-tRNA(Sec) selenium transferase [Companilactobacillus sp.]MCH4078087.1 L-seryl-tRNA(Sec) selenium transferase [Companilactobacillus sp.]MCH4126663.1 L-seryl-tRNA(Sec) selenium transferase [Companilactobacillus sp.]MCH4132248.1 L-seryl-tRNA(Sec) selenium transferase [Companilactobacillus sp.]